MIFVHLNADFLDRDFEFKNQFLDYKESKEVIEKRVYIKICVDDLLFLIPLRRNISQLKSNTSLRGCFYEVPSTVRSNAGLDFTKAILVEEKDILPSKGQIASSQKKKIINDYTQIESMYEKYYKDFKKSLKKGRTSRDQKFKYCVLRNLEDIIIE